MEHGTHHRLNLRNLQTTIIQNTKILSDNVLYLLPSKQCGHRGRQTADGRHRDKITSHVSRSGMTRRGNDNEAVGKLIIFKEIKKKKKKKTGDNDLMNARQHMIHISLRADRRSRGAPPPLEIRRQQFPIKPKFEQFESCFTGMFAVLLTSAAILAA